jgi:uncharacterized protein (DUF305 family)/predicted small secreted protein
MRPRHVPVLLLLACLALTGCGAGGGSGERLAAVGADAPAATSTLAQDLRPLHLEALELSQLVLASDPAADVVAVVSRIEQEQQDLLEQVDGLLVGNAGTPGELGALALVELEALRAAAGDEAVRLGLAGLLRNHLAAVSRAKAEVTEGRTGPAGELAGRVLDQQGAALQQLGELG